MYKPRTMPVLTGEAAARFNDWMQSEASKEAKNYQEYVLAWETIDKRSKDIL